MEIDCHCPLQKPVASAPDRLVNAFRPLLQGIVAGNVRLHFKLARNAPPIKVDRDGFSEILLNLVKNASEALSGRKGDITVETAALELTEDQRQTFAFRGCTPAPGPGALFTVRDNGPGMDLALLDGQNVILNTPTGSGKSLVASALLFAALARGERAVYTCPIKALVNERWMDLCREFGPECVGLSTGDATVNREAPILCCTAEILANMALREGAAADVHHVVMDEFHYYSDRDRGVAWQVPLLTLPQARFLLMSATLGDTTTFERALTDLNGRPTVTMVRTPAARAASMSLSP